MLSRLAGERVDVPREAAKAWCPAFGERDLRRLGVSLYICPYPSPYPSPSALLATVRLQHGCTTEGKETGLRGTFRATMGQKQAPENGGTHGRAIRAVVDPG